jgi:C1A family cysteine protease
VKDALVSYGPLVTNFIVYNDFKNFWDSSGDTVYHRTSTTGIAGHAVVLVGYNDFQQCWICKNSWGYTDGDRDGYFKIGYGEAGITEYGSYYVEELSTTKSISTPLHKSLEESLFRFPILQRILLKL